MPGWSEDGIGYHADDGHLYHGRGVGSHFGPTCTEGKLYSILSCSIIWLRYECTVHHKYTM